ncbi:hypothetical protein NKJ87_32575 [Mesorhizobium sp. M0027]|uniref:hypothetical protein n=1 Tax=unclassified Mesorhizobium TaxID=325217 RepID=UPI003336724C
MVFARYLGTMLAVGLVIWITLSLWSHENWRTAPEVMDLGEAFEGTAQLPKEEIEQRWNQARERMVAINERGRWFSVSGDLCSWFAFACTAAITLIAGYYGRVPAAGSAGTTDTGGLSQGTTRTIAFVAALGAVLTAGGSLAANRGNDDYDRADKARDLINQAVKAVQDAATEREARDALDEMVLKITRL